MRIDTVKSKKRYMVVVIDCWAEDGEHDIEPTAAILKQVEVDADASVTATIGADGSADVVVANGAKRMVPDGDPAPTSLASILAGLADRGVPVMLVRIDAPAALVHVRKSRAWIPSDSGEDFEVVTAKVSNLRIQGDSLYIDGIPVTEPTTIFWLPGFDIAYPGGWVSSRIAIRRGIA